MSYTFDVIEQSQKIIAYLLSRHELSESGGKDLYKSYCDSESVQNLVASQAEALDARVERYEDVIYLMPKEDNTFLGFSKSQLRLALCRSGADDSDYYLALFSILVLIALFYDGCGIQSRTRDFLKFGHWQNAISEYLQKGIYRLSEEEQNESGLLFTAMNRAYESLKSEENLSQKRSTKEGFLNTILRFLREQKLVQYSDDEIIKPSRKFDHFMNWNLLDRANYERVMATMRELDREQN